MITIANSKKYMNKTPWEIVPLLCDDGVYLASESSFYRELNARKLLEHRQKSKPKNVKKPIPLVATGPNQVWSWDITYLPTLVKGLFYYLYLFIDIFSRYIVGAKVYESESMELSSKLISEIYLKNGIQKNQLYLHADNGGSMKGATMLATMQRLKVMPSFSRPSVSNDNPFSESMFKTTKYCSMYPSKPFGSLDAANEWVLKFTNWYNEDHLHSGIKFVTPGCRHRGEDKDLLMKRELIYLQAQQKNPLRWSNNVKNFNFIPSVSLNKYNLKFKEANDRKHVV